MYVTAFYVHWCIVVIHLGNCVAMRHWTPRGQHTVRRALHQSLGGFWAHVQNHEGSEVRRLIWLSSIPHALYALGLISNYEETSFAQRCFFISLSLSLCALLFSNAWVASLLRPYSKLEQQTFLIWIQSGRFITVAFFGC